MGQKKIIALDAGHGMKTSGKRCLKSIDPNQTREWWLNDRIADLVEMDLKKNYDCTVLRVDDTTGEKDISLSARVKVANNVKADFYLSIHHNAGIKGRTGGGTVVFFWLHGSAAVAQRLYNAVISKTGLVGNRKDKVSASSLYVIKNTKMPALLLENGFMDSTHDTPIILTTAHSKKTAHGIVNFLASELGLSKNDSAHNISKPDNKPQENGSYITVNKGDTLSRIGKRMEVAWKDIADLNGLVSPYTLHVGQKLYIPPKTSTQTYYPAYTGKKTTLAAALTSLGINSTYSFRAKIAKANGISGYIGTATQNTHMYNLLVSGLLKKA